MAYGTYFLHVGRGCDKCQECNAYFNNPKPPCSNIAPTVLTNSSTINVSTGAYLSHSFIANETGLVDMTYDGALPSGVGYTNIGGNVCYLSGFPSVPGVYTLKMRARNYCNISPANAAILTVNVSSGGGGGGGGCTMPTLYGSDPAYYPAGTTVYDTTHNVSGYFTSAHNIYIYVYNYPPTGSGGLYPSKFILKANGSTLYDTGCFTGTTAGGEFTVPSGTTTFEAIGICGCGEDPSTNWVAPTYLIDCE